MTACTNNGGSRARRAVTAALVGVLSVGAAPMVALATGAAPASGDVSLQADADTWFKNGFTSYEDGLESGHSFVYSTNASGAVKQGLVPTGVSYVEGGEPDVTLTSANQHNCGTANPSAPGYYYSYVQIDGRGAPITGVTYGDDGTLLRGNILTDTPSNPGNYAVVVFYWNGTGRSYVQNAGAFSIVNGGLEDATLFEGTDVSDDSFAYTGKSANVTAVEGTIGVAVDGVALTKGSDYDITMIHEPGKNTAFSGDLVPNNRYVVEVDGKNAYEGQNATLEFTYQPLNLSTATIVGVGVNTTAAPDTDDVMNAVKSINGVVLDGTTFGGITAGISNPRLDAVVSGPADGGNGTYTYTITPSSFDAEHNNYVTGSATVDVILADAKCAIEYDGAAWGTGSQWGTSADGGYVYTYDMTDSKAKPFDVDEITATYSSEVVPFEISVRNAETGAAGTVSDLTTLGKWAVTVTAQGNAASRYVAEIVTATVNNFNDVSNAKNVFVTYDGKAVTGAAIPADTYTGDDLLDKLSVTVKAGDKTFVEGTDYTIDVTTKDASGKTVKVDSIVDAGDYTITVKGITFDLSTATGSDGVYTLKVNKRTLKEIAPTNAFATDVHSKANSTGGLEYHNVYYFAHTGQEIAPEYSFVGNDDKTYTVPADEFEVTYKLDGATSNSKLKDNGTYVIDKVTVKASSKNFTATSIATPRPAVTSPDTNSHARIVVTDASSFADVPNDAWYAEAVATAKQQGYIGGVGGSNLFAPMRNMSRADVVCVLYRMAGGTIDNEGMTDAEKTYISDFTDVDEGAYYAKAVSWAVKTGIARGYGDTFGTSRDVTTEEFATMLARYAASVGTDTSVDTDAVLSGVADGDKVSSYARDAVAWAVENGYVASNGNLIDPQGSVYRARVVTIAVRYQPEQLHVIL